MYLLDTIVLCEVLRRRPRDSVVERLRRTDPEMIHASIITFFEMRYGSMLRQDNERFWSRIETEVVPLVTRIAIDEPVALEAGSVAATLRKSGRQIGLADSLIAACAIVHKLTLVTENLRHFERIQQLKCEVW